MKRLLAMLMLMCAPMSMTGCTNYYRVTDPSSGAVYYTTKVSKEKGGAVAFRDERTNRRVTIQNSEIETIDPDEFTRSVQARGK